MPELPDGPLDGPLDPKFLKALTDPTPASPEPLDHGIRAGLSRIIAAIEPLQEQSKYQDMRADAQAQAARNAAKNALRAAELEEAAETYEEMRRHLPDRNKRIPQRAPCAPPPKPTRRGTQQTQLEVSPRVAMASLMFFPPPTPRLAGGRVVRQPQPLLTEEASSSGAPSPTLPPGDLAPLPYESPRIPRWVPAAAATAAPPAASPRVTRVVTLRPSRPPHVWRPAGVTPLEVSSRAHYSGVAPPSVSPSAEWSEEELLQMIIDLPPVAGSGLLKAVAAPKAYQGPDASASRGYEEEQPSQSDLGSATIPGDGLAQAVTDIPSPAQNPEGLRHPSPTPQLPQRDTPDAKAGSGAGSGEVANHYQSGTDEVNAAIGDALAPAPAASGDRDGALESTATETHLDGGGDDGAVDASGVNMNDSIPPSSLQTDTDSLIPTPIPKPRRKFGSHLSPTAPRFGAAALAPSSSALPLGAPPSAPVAAAAYPQATVRLAPLIPELKAPSPGRAHLKLTSPSPSVLLWAREQAAVEGLLPRPSAAPQLPDRTERNVVQRLQTKLASYHRQASHPRSSAGAAGYDDYAAHVYSATHSLAGQGGRPVDSPRRLLSNRWDSAVLCRSHDLRPAEAAGTAHPGVEGMTPRLPVITSPRYLSTPTADAASSRAADAAAELRAQLLANTFEDDASYRARPARWRAVR